MTSLAARLSVALWALSCVFFLFGCQASGADDGEPATESASTVPEEGRIWAPDEGDHLWFGAASPDELGPGGEFHIYVDPETHPQARASFAKFSLGVGGALPVHRHDRTEEIAYFISGEGVVRSGEDLEETAVGPGYVWYNPPGIWHSITNTGSEKLTLVFATIPNEKSGLLSFFREVSARPGEEPRTLSPEEFVGLAVEHDLILRPPDEVAQ